MKSTYCQSQLCCCPSRGASWKLKPSFADSVIWLLPNSSCCSIYLFTLFKVKPANSRPKLCTNCLPHLRLTEANCMDGNAISLNFNTTLVDDSHSCSGQDRLYSAHNAAHCRERQTQMRASKTQFSSCFPSSGWEIFSENPDLHLGSRSGSVRFFFNLILVWKGQVECHQISLSQYFFSNFGWPHEYKHMKVQQYQNWIHTLILAARCGWIFNIISQSKLPVQDATLESFSFFWRLQLST